MDHKVHQGASHEITHKVTISGWLIVGELSKRN